MVELTPNEIQIKVEEKGYDVFPVKEKNGKYRMIVWFGDEDHLGKGKIEYMCCKEGVRKTYEIIAKKLKIIEI